MRGPGRANDRTHASTGGLIPQRRPATLLIKGSKKEKRRKKPVVEGAGGTGETNAQPLRELGFLVESSAESVFPCCGEAGVFRCFPGLWKTVVFKGCSPWVGLPQALQGFPQAPRRRFLAWLGRSSVIGHKKSPAQRGLAAGWKGLDLRSPSRWPPWRYRPRGRYGTWHRCVRWPWWGLSDHCR